MEQLSPDYGVSRRRLRVFKLRGVQFREGWHDYLIRTGGLQVFPRLVAAEHRGEFVRVSISSGIRELDELLGGGLDCGTTTLVMGAAGTGKSSLALHYAAQFAAHGERSLLFTFDETVGILYARARALGLKLDEHARTGMFTAQQVDPAELSPGEFAVRVQSALAAGTRMVVIDSLNGYMNAMPGEQYLSNQLHELSSFLNQQGVVTIIIMAQHGFLATLQSPIDISYLADTVVALRYFEVGGAVKQAIAVLKKRSGPHEKTIREFRMEPGRGVRVGEPLTDFQGVLTGVPDFRGPRQRIMT
jgi:circadian clock protein KaiC